MRITPNVTINLRKPKQTDDASVPQEPTPDYAKIAEEAIARLGVKLLIGTGALIATYFICKVGADVLTNALDNTLTE